MLAKFDLKLVRSTCKRYKFDPSIKPMYYLLDALDTSSPAHRATAQAIRQEMSKQFFMSESCFIEPCIRILFHEDVLHG